MAEHHPKSAYGTRLVVVVLVSLMLAGCGSSTSVPTYSISGRVTRASDNSGLDGITLQFSGGLGTATTAGGGYWRKDGLKGTVTVTPTGQEWAFNPPNRTVSSSASDVNFQASPAGTPAYSVSGYVRDNLGNAIRDVAIEFDRGFGSAKTGADGKWTKSGLSGTVTATPKKDGWTFSPVSRPVDGSASNVDFTGAYRVGGLISDVGGTPVSSVRLDFSGGHSSAYTGSDGVWTKQGLSGDVTVTPNLANWTFSPSSRTVSGPYDQVNFTRTYSVSGRVTDQQGRGMPYVQIKFSGGHYSSFTDDNGYWTKTSLSGPITITPEAVGYTFIPGSLSVSGPTASADFTAVAISSEFSVSGRVTGSGGVGIADVLLFLGSGFGTARTAPDGRWSATGLSGDVTVTPAKAGLVFTPETVTVSGSSNSINFVGSSATNTYSVSGRVTDSSDGSGLYAVSFTFSGGFGRAQSDVIGYWSKSELYGPVTITPSRPGWVFQPQSRTVTGSSNAVDFVGSRSGGSASEGGDK